jgi:KaiC/GvpD/RAD55 family RecA-like ATPase
MGALTKHIKKTKETVNKGRKPGSVSETMFIPLEIKNLDYHTGTIGTNRETGDEFANLGIPMGKIHMGVGHSQGGKTTLMLQIANAIVKDLNGDVVVCDFERSHSDPRTRIKNICGIDDDTYDERFTFFNHEDMTAEFLKKHIFDIVKIKRDMKTEDLVDWFDIEGNEIKIYPPTVYLIDSVSAMRPKELLENPESDNNMVHAMIAKSNSSFVVSIQHLLEAYNITILAVGHITTKIQTQAYAPRKIQLPGLADDENIPGGNKFVYESSYLFKLSHSKELKKDKDMGIDGRIANLRLLKTRSGYNNVTIPMVFHSVLGFHSRLTDFYHLKEHDILKGGGSKGFFLPDNEEHRYVQREWAAKLIAADDEELIQLFDDKVDEVYNALLTHKVAENVIGNGGEAMEEEFEE